MTERNTPEFKKSLELHETNIPGLVWFDLTVNDDNRGSFTEKFQLDKMQALGLPEFNPIQMNHSYNQKAGTTRGIHAEPWDKFISPMNGRVFGAWVDLREGDTFGQTFTIELDASKAIYVPRGVGNAFQTLDEDVDYTYLVNDHWSPEAKDYPFVNLADPSVNIPWPIPIEQTEQSEKDKTAPFLESINPVKPKKILITGANGQLGKALAEEFPDAELVDRSALDVSDNSTWGEWEWHQYQAIINAAAYTKVDQAETPEGRIEAWNANATAVQNLARVAIDNHLTLIHVSSDYVFNGTQEDHTEDEPFSPLGVYGQSKAAGDIAAATVPKHYIARTSWVVGEGNNFIKIMQKLANNDVSPTVVNDQIGRLTFTEDLAQGIKHLLDTKAPYGTYNITNSGEPVSWADVAKEVFEESDRDTEDVTGVSTEEYYKGKEGIAPRPLQSTLNIDKIQNAGFTPRPWDEALEEYLR